MSLIDDLKLIEEQAAEGIAKAPSLDELDKIRVAVTGKKGSLTGVLRSMGKVSPEERRCDARWPGIRFKRLSRG